MKSLFDTVRTNVIAWSGVISAYSLDKFMHLNEALQSVLSTVILILTLIYTIRKIFKYEQKIKA